MNAAQSSWHIVGVLTCIRRLFSSVTDCLDTPTTCTTTSVVQHRITAPSGQNVKIAARPPPQITEHMLIQVACSFCCCCCLVGICLFVLYMACTWRTYTLFCFSWMTNSRRLGLCTTAQQTPTNKYLVNRSVYVHDASLWPLVHEKQNRTGRYNIVSAVWNSALSHSEQW